MAQNGLIPVTFERHGHRYWRRFTSYAFARNRLSCAVVSAEIHHAAAAFPVVFHRTGDAIEPIAVLSLTPGTETPFVSPDSRWLASYVPSALRCPPFEIGRVGVKTEDPVCLLLDETTDLLTDDPQDELFFTQSGDLSSELQRVWAFLKRRMSMAQQTRALCSSMVELDLFEPLICHEGVDLPPGLLGISSERLANLPQPHTAILMNNGGLRLIHAHQVSLCHFAWLAQAHRQATRTEATQNTEIEPGLSVFLSAMADAHLCDGLSPLGKNGGSHAEL